MTARRRKRLRVKKDVPGTKPGRCGAPRGGLHKGEPCQNPAGLRTSHPGQGRCHRHEMTETARNKVLKHGWCSMITHRRVSNMLQEMATQEANVMDLVPEANLLRALAIDFINNYDVFVEALMKWYADPESNTRPRKVMDLADVAHLIEAISRVIHRMHQIQTEGAISLEAFQRVTSLMGITVAQHVKDPVILEKIEQGWQDLAIDAKAPPPASTTDDK